MSKEPAQVILDRLYELRGAFMDAGLEPPIITLVNEREGHKLQSVLLSDPYICQGDTKPIAIAERTGDQFEIKVLGFTVRWPRRDATIALDTVMDRFRGRAWKDFRENMTWKDFENDYKKLVSS